MNRRVVKVLLLATLLLVCFSGMVFAADDVGYRLEGTLDVANDTIDIDIYIQSVKAGAGRFALDYDESKVELVNGSSLTSAITPASRITILSEGLEDSVLISSTDGYVCFAWSPSSTALDATSSDKHVASISFKLLDGVSSSDLDADTFRMLDVSDNPDLGWSSGAWIFGEGFIHYENGVSGRADCKVNFTYPGSNIAPIYSYNVEVLLQNTAAQPISGKLIIGTEEVTVGADGIAKAKKTEGKYNCRVIAKGYEEKVFSLNLTKDTKTTVSLRSYQELVNDVARGLAIGYAGGDSASSVTKDLKLATTGEAGTMITWSSSSQKVLSDYGNVFPDTKATKVTLTATVSKEGKVATKSFAVTIAAKGSGGSGTDTTTPEKPEVIIGNFTDLGSVPWAHEAILALSEAGVINGVTATSYAPNAPITRGDYIALIMRMLDPKGTASEGFSDVPTNSYYYGEITLAKALGVAEGYEGNRFLPKNKILRQDMMTLSYRTLIKMNYLDESTSKANISSFADFAKVAEYAKTPMTVLVAQGYITGNANNTLAPVSSATRAEAAVFLYRIYQDINMAK